MLIIRSVCICAAFPCDQLVVRHFEITFVMSIEAVCYNDLNSSAVASSPYDLKLVDIVIGNYFNGKFITQDSFFEIVFFSAFAALN